MYFTQNNFNGGIVTEWIDTRYDLNRYKNSLRKAENFVCTPYGGLRRRMGTEHVEVAGSKARLIGFQLSNTEGYVLEFGEQYMRVHKDGARLGTVELTTPWSAEEVFEIQYIKLNTIIILTHKDHHPQQLKYIDDATWTMTDVDFDYPAFRDAPLDGRELTVTSDGTITNEEVVVLNVTGSVTVVETDFVPVAGGWEVVVTSYATTGGGAYLKLQKSLDGGTIWSDVQTFAADGTYTGTEAGGLLKLVSLETTHNSTLTSGSEVDELAEGDTVVVDATGGDVFEAGHVGSEFEFSHIPEVTETRLSLESSGTSSTITLQGTWRMFTSGTWSGTITLEKSTDNGASYDSVIQRTGSADRNIVEDGEIDEKVLMRVRFSKTDNGSSSPHVTIESDGSAIKGRVLITAVNSATQADGTVVAGIYSGDATDEWREGAWSDLHGYPAAIAWHESRVWYAGTASDPSTLWASATDDFYNYEEGTNDDQAFQRTIATTELTNILWLASHTNLYIGTSGEEWRGFSESDSGVITPGSFILRRISNSGSEPISPVLAGSHIIHVQRQGRSVFQISYDAASATIDGYVPTDLNQLAPHVTLGGVTTMAYQTIRDRIIWATTGEGKLIGLTFDRQQNIAGWHEHNTLGDIESVCTVYEEGNEDSIYITVNRSGSRHVERMRLDQYDILENQEQIEGLFTDSSVSYDGIATDTITGLAHLNGYVVQVVADGAYIGEFTVSGDELELGLFCTTASVGIGYTSLMETLPLMFDAGDGSSVGRYKRSVEGMFRVYRSVTCQVAANSRGAYTWQTMKQDWRQFVDLDVKPTDNEQGSLEDWKVPLSSGYDRDARIAVQIEQPYPLNILALTTKFDFGG